MREVDYNLPMEIKDVVTKVLKDMGLADKWRCHQPAHGALAGPVVLQCEVHTLEASFPVTRHDLDFPWREEFLKKRIRAALANARLRSR
jgi:hypothetical protein